MQASQLTSGQRRGALVEVCQRGVSKAKDQLAAMEVKQGDGFVEAFEEATNEGGEGGVYVRRFEILKAVNHRFAKSSIGYNCNTGRLFN